MANKSKRSGKSELKLLAATFVISFIVIAMAVIMGWADEPLNGLIESNARKNMGWFDRTMLDLAGPQDMMARMRREDFQLVAEFGFVLGFLGAVATTVAVAIGNSVLYAVNKL
jgi:hypothetical protein